MNRPDPLVVGNGVTIAKCLDSVQVGDDLDAPSDHRRMDGVVVAGQCCVERVWAQIQPRML